jgi:sugar transport system permease protein
MSRCWREFVLEGVLVVLCIVLAFAAPGFLTTDNLLRILYNVSMKGVIAFGMTMVIIAGEIDLSVGSMVAFSGCMMAWCTGYLSGDHAGWPMALAVAAAFGVTLAAGMAAGAISGLLRARMGVPTFISTLAWLTALQGISGKITNGIPLLTFPEWYNFFGAGAVWKIPFPAIVLLMVFALSHFVMNYTTFGRAVYAVGGNEKSARLSGINVSLVKIGVMVIVAALAVMAGVMQSSQIMTGLDRAGRGWELDVIASVIIGGTSLSGGAGRVWSTLVGIVFMGVLLNGMTLWNIDEYWQLIVRGALVLVAVLLNQAAPGVRR